MNMAPFATLPHRRGACFSDLQLDRLAAGECIGQAATHINTCSVCTRQLQERRDEQARFNATHRATAQKPWLRFSKFKARPTLAMSAAAAAAILLAVLPRAAPDIHTKGTASLRIITATDPDHALRDGDTVRVGERLRFLVDTETPGFVAVLGRDNTGSVWNATPAQTRMMQIDPGKDQLLSGAVALDDQGAEEDVHFFACVRQTDIQRLIASMTDANTSNLPVDCTVTHTHIRKANK